MRSARRLRGVEEEFLPPDLGDRDLRVAVGADQGRAGAGDQDVAEHVLLEAAEAVEIGDVAQDVGGHVGAVGVARVARPGLGIGAAPLGDADDAVDRRLDAVDHDRGLTASMQLGQLLARELVGVVVVDRRQTVAPRLIGQLLMFGEVALEPVEVRKLRRRALRRTRGDPSAGVLRGDRGPVLPLAAGVPLALGE